MFPFPATSVISGASTPLFLFLPPDKLGYFGQFLGFFKLSVAERQGTLQ